MSIFGLKLIGGWLAAALLLGAATVRAEQPVPPFRAYVTDRTATLTAAQQSQLEQKLRDFSRRRGSQIGVLIVPTTQPETIEQYSIRVAEQWKLGRKGVDDGVLLVLAKNDRKYRLEIGYGLEGVLTDAASKRIEAETIRPFFKRGDFYGGLAAGVDQIMQRVNSEPLPPRQQTAPARRLSTLQWLAFLGMTLLLIGAAIIGCVKGRWVMIPAICSAVITALFAIFAGGWLLILTTGAATFIAVFAAGKWLLARKSREEELAARQAKASADLQASIAAIRRTQPSRLDSSAQVDRLAREIRDKLGVPWLQALDLAAQRAGYQSYAHARGIESDKNVDRSGGRPSPSGHGSSWSSPGGRKHRSESSGRSGFSNWESSRTNSDSDSGIGSSGGSGGGLDSPIGGGGDFGGGGATDPY